MHLLDPEKRGRSLLHLPPPGPDREAGILRLVRHRWLEPADAEALIAEMSDEGLKREARVWHGAQPLWIADLADLATRRSLDPADLSLEPLLRRLWDAAEEGRAALAGAVIDALRAGGRPRAECALKLWLHAELAPRLGVGQPEKAQRAEALAEILARGLHLSPAAAAPARSES